MHFTHSIHNTKRMCENSGNRSPMMNRRHARLIMTMRSVAFLLSVALLLLSSHPTGVGVAASNYEDEHDEVYDGDYDDDSEDDYDDDYDKEYESKMEQALSHHATKSHQLLERALQEGGFASNSNGDELWQAEFSLNVLQRELGIILAIQEVTFPGNVGEDPENEEEWVYPPYDPENEDLPLLKDDPELKIILDAIEDEEYRDSLYIDIQEKADHKAELDPELWYEFTYWDLQAYFSCRRVFAGTVPVYDTEKWNGVRQLYQDFVKKDKKDRSYDEDNPKRMYQFSTESFDPPIEPFQAGGAKGRGIKAARDISKGELVFKATENTVIFTNGHTWRKFLFAINERYDNETTCDVLVWSWVQAIEKGGPLVIVSDFDNGSLLNEGREDPGFEPPNVRCGKEGDTMCMMEYYATKDIKEGDELLCDYRDFALLWSWADMGL
mmetsp:Transcript_19268/g.41788  ORF Transcript_19268/g.41788 Transcript_19268/m.41788 type:complete len:439 (+) Transcript_19268:81-1397(+)